MMRRNEGKMRERRGKGEKKCIFYDCPFSSWLFFVFYFSPFVENLHSPPSCSPIYSRSTSFPFFFYSILYLPLFISLFIIQFSPSLFISLSFFHSFQFQ